MTDIVERLRSYSAGGIEADKQAEDWMEEAADDIERLREALRDIACDCEHDCADSPLGLSPITDNCCRNFARVALGEKE